MILTGAMTPAGAWRERSTGGVSVSQPFVVMDRAFGETARAEQVQHDMVVVDKQAGIGQKTSERHANAF